MLSSLNELSPQELRGKRVLFRVDYNLPMQDGEAQDESRLIKSLSTLRFLMESEAKVVVMTHFGRPKGQVVEELRVDPLARILEKYAGVPVKKLDDCIGPDVEAAISAMQDGEVVMLENLRFHSGEKENSPEFVEALAKLGDLFVTDAFGAAHRAHASTYGVPQKLPAYAGFLLMREVRILGQVLDSPTPPLCLVVGGAKIDTKIGILQRFLEPADSFLIGGAMANTFLAAQGHDVGGSLYQEDKIEMAKSFLDAAEGLGKTVLLPRDVSCATEISEEAAVQVLRADEVQGEQKILDIGPESAHEYVQELNKAKTIIWNGPMGLYELDAFAKGSRALAEAIAAGDAVSIVGGGDSVDAINKFGIAQEKFTHISTGGGAMLEFMEGKELPGIQVLQK